MYCATNGIHLTGAAAEAIACYIGGNHMQIIGSVRLLLCIVDRGQWILRRDDGIIGHDRLSTVL